jgi:hypothetical protein
MSEFFASLTDCACLCGYASVSLLCFVSLLSKAPLCLRLMFERILSWFLFNFWSSRNGVQCWLSLRKDGRKEGSQSGLGCEVFSVLVHALTMSGNL